MKKYIYFIEDKCFVGRTMSEETQEQTYQTVEQTNKQEDMHSKLVEEAMRIRLEKRYVENEAERLRAEVQKLRLEMERMKRPPLIVGYLKDVLTNGDAIIKSSSGPDFVVSISTSIAFKDLIPGSRVSLNRQNLSIIEVLPLSKDPIINAAQVIEKPDVGFNNIGGLDDQILEIKEIIELPMKYPKLFEKVGIEPPRGVLLIGPPGTGKTLLAKAVAKETNATYIRLVGSELVQKFIGEGARLVRELFQLAKEKSPSIIFIDEVDTIGAKRIDIGTSGDREVQRTLMQLLSEIDGFNNRGEVKMIAATNRPDILDNALLRPGRFDRIINIPIPSNEARKEILKIHSRKMSLKKDVDLEILSSKCDGATGADIKAICTEAGMFAIREHRNKINFTDFEKAVSKILCEKENQTVSGMFA